MQGIHHNSQTRHRPSTLTADGRDGGRAHGASCISPGVAAGGRAPSRCRASCRGPPAPGVPQVGPGCGLPLAVAVPFAVCGCPCIACRVARCPVAAGLEASRFTCWAPTLVTLSILLILRRGLRRQRRTYTICHGSSPTNQYRGKKDIKERDKKASCERCFFFPAQP